MIAEFANLKMPSTGSLIESTFGVLMIGMSIAAVLHGLITMQCIYYFMNYPDDKWSVKGLVFVVFILDTIQLGCMIRTVYEYLVLDFGNVIPLLYTVWTLNIEVLLTCLITFVIRLFFTRRVWVVSGRNKPLTALILFIGIAQMGLGGWVSALMFVEKAFTRIPKFKPALTLQVSFGIAGDLLIGFTLCYYLFKSRTGVGRTNQILNTLIIWTVNTGLTMAITETCVLITFLASPYTFVFIAIHFFVSKVYSNSLLASLNNRRRIRGAFGSGYISEFETDSSPHSNSNSPGPKGRSRLFRIGRSRHPKAFTEGTTGSGSSNPMDSRSRGPQFSSALVFGTSCDVGDSTGVVDVRGYDNSGAAGRGDEHHEFEDEYAQEYGYGYGLNSLEAGVTKGEGDFNKSKESIESRLGAEADTRGVRFEMVNR